MKKMVLALASLFMVLTASAQKNVEGSFPSLKGVKKINLVVDYSEMQIDNKTVADWLEYRQAEQPKYDANKELDSELKPTVVEKLTDEINSKLKKSGAYVVTNNSADYTLRVKPISVAKKGNNTNECAILDKEGNVLVKFEIKGSGGTFGSMANLWGDGYEDTGKKLGGVVAKCMK